MTGRPSTGGFAARPVQADAWVKATEPSAGPEPPAFSARLTIDITPALRARIKVTAFQRGITVADMLRGLLDREFPDDRGAGA